MSSTLSSRDSRLDLLRLVAFFLLIACHACDPFNAAATYGSGEANAEFARWGAIWGAAVRPCVPLFVMLTGALLLGHSGREQSPVPLRAFYARRIPRAVYPFVIWSCIYYLFPWILGLLGYGSEALALFFPWGAATDQTFFAALERIVCIPYSFNYIASHMWYIYMLVGMYLYIPIFDAWVSQSTERQQRFVLILWGISTFLPYLTEFVSPFSFGTCEWNQFGLFYYFSGFSGYLLLGYYLRRHVRLSLPKAVAVAVPMFAVGYAVTLWGYRQMLALESPTPLQIELFWTYCSPNVLLMTLAVSLVTLQVPLRRPRLNARLSGITRCGFGIFMVHYFFVGPTCRAVTVCGMPVALCIPVAAVLILVESWLVVALLKRLLGERLGRIVLG